MKARIPAIVVLAFLTGCGGAATFALKRPISNACASKGLKGCDDLTDAALAYASGDKAEAEPKLRAAAAANTPAQMKEFAVALKPIADNAGGEAGEGLRTVIGILSGAPPAPPAEKAARATASAAKPAASSPTPSAPPGGAAVTSTTPGSAIAEVDRLTATMPAGLDDNATECRTGAMAAGAGRCYRSNVFEGPFVVTNLYASGGCTDDLFVMTGATDHPQWIVLNPAGATLNIQGALFVERGKTLVLGARTKNPALNTDVRCSITWSGYRVPMHHESSRSQYSPLGM